MKIFTLVVYLVVIFSISTSRAHVKKEEGWFYKYVRHAIAEQARNREQIFEKKHDDTTDSAVVLVHGIQAFNKLVLVQSSRCPVVVKFFSPQSIDSIKVKSVFQEVAEVLKKDVAFVAINILEDHEVFAKIMLMYHLNQVTLPLFLFYKDGQLYTPQYEPTPMVQGYLTKENLEHFIKKKFALKNSIVGVVDSSNRE